MRKNNARKSVLNLCKDSAEKIKLNVSKQMCYFKRYKIKNLEVDRAQEIDPDPLQKAIPSSVNLFQLARIRTNKQ